MYYARRITLAVVCIWWNSQPNFQLALVIFFNMIGAIMQLHIKPLKTRSSNISLAYDDITIIIIIDLMFCCTDLLHIGSARYAVGYIIIFVTLLNTLINLIVICIWPIRCFILRTKYFYLLNKRYPGILKSRCKHFFCRCCMKKNSAASTQKK